MTPERLVVPVPAFPEPLATGFARTLAQIQGWFYLISGVWPIVSPGSFQAVTGAKQDFWLAQTVGIQLAIVGAALVSAARHRRLSRELAFIALGTAAALGIMDVYCVREPRTTPAYLLDAVAEAGLVVAWVLALRAERRSAKRAGDPRSERPTFVENPEPRPDAG